MNENDNPFNRDKDPEGWQTYENSVKRQPNPQLLEATAEEAAEVAANLDQAYDHGYDQDQLNSLMELAPPDEPWEVSEKLDAEQKQIPEGVQEAMVERFEAINWDALWEEDFSEIDFLPGKFMERGQQVALVGQGKAGKSLFALDWAWRCAAGRSFLADAGRESLRVLYLDKENSRRDIALRLKSLGASKQQIKTTFIYMMFPAFSSSFDEVADRNRASRELIALVEFYRADIVIIDTVSRFISGKENDADTWLQLYQGIHERLKRRKIACLRLDHFGKDETSGSRGSSAKSQDVDHVWELRQTSVPKLTQLDVGVQSTVTLELKRTHTRTGLGEDIFRIQRVSVKGLDGAWLANHSEHRLDGGDTRGADEAHRDEQLQRMALELADEMPPGLSGNKFETAWTKDRGINISNTQKRELHKMIVRIQSERLS